MWPLRAKSNIRGKKRPSAKLINLEVTSVNFEKYERAYLPKDVPVSAALPIWSERAGIITGRSRFKKLEGSQRLRMFIDRKAESARRKEFIDFGQNLDIPVEDYARMICKIAHCICVSEFGIDGFDPYLIDIIIRGRDDWEYFVGCVETKMFDATRKGNLHQWCFIVEKNNSIIVLIEIFSPWKIKETYEVVAGRIRSHLRYLRNRKQ